MDKKQIRRVLKKAAAVLFVFLLSFVRLFGSAAPFGLPAVLCAGALDPVYLIAFAFGRFFADVGAFGFFRGLLSLTFSLLSGYFFSHRVSKAALCALSTLFSGALLLIVRPSSHLAVDTAIEALFAGVFFVVFSRVRGLLSDKYRRAHMTGGELLMGAMAASALLLSLADVSVGPFSPTAAALLALSMALSYRYEAMTAAALSMAVGCTFLVFLPEAYAAVVCLSLASALSASLRRFGRYGVPLCFLSLFFVFSLFSVSPFWLWDVALGGVLFCLIPRRLFDLLGASLPRERTPLRLKEALGSLSDTFAAMAAMFAPQAAGGQETDTRKAAEGACGAVCASCTSTSSCQKVARQMLSAKASAASFADPHFLAFCRRRRALQSEFTAFLRLSRQETLMHMALCEEGAALSGQMTYLSGVFGRLSSEETHGLYRNDSAENALKAAFRRAGVRADDVGCALPPSGGALVTLCIEGCGKIGLCDTRIPDIIEEVIGLPVERLGLKPCDKGGTCHLRYSALSSLSINVGARALPFSEESGDAFAALRVDERTYALILSDGMGTGAEAADLSRTVVEMSARLLSVGMDIETVVAMVNTLLLSRTGGRGFATLDMAVIDLESGRCRYVKNGASPGCLVHSSGRIVPLSGEGSPLGTITSVRVRVQKTEIKDGDMLILTTDGAADALEAHGGFLARVGEFTSGSPEDMASFIARGALRFGEVKDHITVLAAGCIKRAAFGKDRHIWDDEAFTVPSNRKQKRNDRRIEA